MPRPGFPRGAHGFGRWRSSRGSFARLARQARLTRPQNESLRRQAGPCRFQNRILCRGATRLSLARRARFLAR